jgi:hypothetical protein
MKKIVLFVVVTCAVSVMASAQQTLTYAFEHKATTDQQPPVKIVEGKHLTMAFEMKAVPNAPYQAEAVTESVMTLADGNRIVKKTTTRVYRDSAGRTRKETVGPDGQVVAVFISDPAGNASYAIDPASQTASRTAVFYYTVADKNGERPAGGTIAHAAVPPGGGTVAVSTSSGAGAATWTATTGSAAGAAHAQEIQKSVIVTAGEGGVFKVVEGFNLAKDVVKEELGEQTIEGILANGTRTTSTIPAGALDNEQPIRIVSEEWFSPELQVLVLTRHSDPRVGETTYRLTNISRTEPVKSLFELPAGYTVKTPEFATVVDGIKK